MHLCDQLATEDGLRAAAQALAAQIAASAPLAVASIRATMRANLVDEVSKSLNREAAEQDRLRQTDDFREGVQASFERRDPNFRGR
jgi:enoyl-CoA hydratase/carnithine racemase